MSFDKIVVDEFEFLHKYNFYEVVKKNEVVYEKKNILIRILYNAFSYEINIVFYLKNDEIKLDLQEFLDYYQIKELGMYQIPCLGKMQLGINYMSGVLKKVMHKLNDIEEEEFKKVFSFSSNKRKKMLDEYYIQVELDKAEKRWKEEKYEEVQTIYEKYFYALTDLQRKRLSYIKKHLST